MIRQEVKQTLFQFKRIYKKQIAPTDLVLDVNLENMIKRKILHSMDNIALGHLVKKIIKSIDQYQNKRAKPHQGLIKFRETLLSQTGIIT
jgi:hypothetical protein